MSWKIKLAVVLVAGILFLLLVLPVVGENKQQLNHMAKYPSVKKALNDARGALQKNKVATPSVLLVNEDSGLVQIFTSREGYVVVLGKAGRAGFLATPIATNSGVVWKCQSILNSFAWAVTCE